MLLIENDDNGYTLEQIIAIYNSNDGSGSDTSVSTGNYSGSTAKMVQDHNALEKVGPIFKPYDPAWSALLAMNF